MPDIAIRGRDVVADHVARAPEMRIATRSLAPVPWPLFLLETRGSTRRRHGIRIPAPEIRSGPVRRISVVAVVLDLLLARDRLICLDWRTLFHLAFAQGDVDPPAVPVHITESHRRDEDLSAAQPAGRINHQMANREARIVEVEGVDMPDVTIGRADREAFEVPHASEHRWLRWECPS